MLEQAFDALSDALSDPLFWAERLVPALFFLLLGGLFGSFLNVVAYRVPRGGSVVGRRSHCPRCGTMIRGRDNVPVLGWLLLGGRCYACRGWISARYPVVEAIMATGVMLLATRELATNGGNLPGGAVGYPDGPDLVFMHASWRVMGMFAWHVAVLATLVVWSLFSIDAYRPSRAGLLVVITLLALPGVVMPGLLPLGLAGNLAASGGETLWTAVASAVATAAVGAGVGWLAGAIPGSAVAATGSAWVWRAAGAASGAVLGWQGAIAVALLSLALAILWDGICLMAGGWRPGKNGWFRSASLALPVASVVVIGWWRELLAVVSFWFSHSISAVAGSTL